MSSTWTISFQNNTAAPVASASITHMNVSTSSGSLSSSYQWQFLSLPANSPAYAPTGSFQSSSGYDNDWSIVITDQNNRAYGNVVHSAVASSPSTGTVYITLTYSGGNYSVTIDDRNGHVTNTVLGALNTTYGF